MAFCSASHCPERAEVVSLLQRALLLLQQERVSVQEAPPPPPTSRVAPPRARASRIPRLIKARKISPSLPSPPSLPSLPPSLPSPPSPPPSLPRPRRISPPVGPSAQPRRIPRPTKTIIGSKGKALTMEVGSSRELEDMFRDMHPPFEGKESEGNWTAREGSILKLRKLTKGNAPHEFTAVYLAGIKGLLDGILKTVNSLRTTVSTNGCELVREIATAVGSGLDPMVEILLQNLIKLCGGTKKISAQNGNMTVDAILANVTYNVRLLQHIWTACQDKNVQPRTYATVWLKTLITKHAHHKSTLEHGGGLDLLEKCIKKGLGDANPGVRESTRGTFWAFAPLWPQKSDAIMSALDAKQKDLLEKDPGNPNLGKSTKAPAVDSGISGPSSRDAASRTALKETIAAQKRAKLAAKKVPDHPGSIHPSAPPVHPSTSSSESVSVVKPSTTTSTANGRATTKNTTKATGKVKPERLGSPQPSVSTIPPNNLSSSLTSMAKPSGSAPTANRAITAHKSAKLGVKDTLERPRTTHASVPPVQFSSSTSMVRPPTTMATANRTMNAQKKAKLPGTHTSERPASAQPTTSPDQRSISSSSSQSSVRPASAMSVARRAMPVGPPTLGPRTLSSAPIRPMRPDRPALKRPMTTNLQENRKPVKIGTPSTSPMVSPLKVKTNMTAPVASPAKESTLTGKLGSPMTSPVKVLKRTELLEEVFIENRTIRAGFTAKNQALDELTMLIPTMKATTIGSPYDSQKKAEITNDPFVESESTSAGNVAPSPPKTPEIITPSPPQTPENVVPSPLETPEVPAMEILSQEGTPIEKHPKTDGRGDKNKLAAAEKQRHLAAAEKQKHLAEQRRLLDSAIIRARAKTLDVHGLRKLQVLVKTKDEIWDDSARFTDLLFALLESLESHYAIDGTTQNQKALVLYTVRLMHGHHQESFSKSYQIALSAMLTTRTNNPKSSRLGYELDLMIEEIISCCDPNEGIETVLELLDSEDGSPISEPAVATSTTINSNPNEDSETVPDVLESGISNADPQPADATSTTINSNPNETIETVLELLEPEDDNPDPGPAEAMSTTVIRNPNEGIETVPVVLESGVSTADPHLCLTASTLVEYLKVLTRLIGAVSERKVVMSEEHKHQLSELTLEFVSDTSAEIRHACFDLSLGLYDCIGPDAFSHMLEGALPAQRSLLMYFVSKKSKDESILDESILDESIF